MVTGKSKKLSLGLVMVFSFLSISTQAANNLSCANIENTAITASTAHLTDNSDGTVTDSGAELIWKKCSEGQTWNVVTEICDGVADEYKWQNALERVQLVNQGLGENFSQSDWRLPNIKELTSIVEFRCQNPAINNTVFPNMPTNQFGASNFWSSSPSTFFTGSALAIVFRDGNISARGKNLSANAVRLIRDKN